MFYVENYLSIIFHYFLFVQNLKLSSDKAQSLEGDLTSTKHKLLELQEQLEMTEKVRTLHTMVSTLCFNQGITLQPVLRNKNLQPKKGVFLSRKFSQNESVVDTIFIGRLSKTDIASDT